MEELSEIDLFCKLIKYPSIRASMLKCFKVTGTSADLMANDISFKICLHLIFTFLFVCLPDLDFHSRCIIFDLFLASYDQQ